MGCGCAERREAIRNAWHRVKGMTNDWRAGVQQKRAEDVAARARIAERERIARRQQELSLSLKRRSF